MAEVKVLTLREAQSIARAKGIKVTRGGLYYSAKKFGFIDNECKPILFLEDGFNKWLNDRLEKPGREFMTVNKMADKFMVNKGKIYSVLREHPEIEVKNFGVGRGIMYVRWTGIKKFIGNDKSTNKEKGKDEKR